MTERVWVNVFRLTILIFRAMWNFASPWYTWQIYSFMSFVLVELCNRKSCDSTVRVNRLEIMIMKMMMMLLLVMELSRWKFRRRRFSLYWNDFFSNQYMSIFWHEPLGHDNENYRHFSIFWYQQLVIMFVRLDTRIFQWQMIDLIMYFGCVRYYALRLHYSQFT